MCEDAEAEAEAEAKAAAGTDLKTRIPRNFVGNYIYEFHSIIIVIIPIAVG